MKPGEYFLDDQAISANGGRRTTKVVVRHTGTGRCRWGVTIIFTK